MGRDYGRNDMRHRIAHLAARLMAEDGIEDYARAKRKAARQAGMADTKQLPSNEEVDEALRVQQSLYHHAEHDARLRDLRERALKAMREFTAFNPRLTGSVLNGNAGRYADIELHLCTDQVKAVELFLLDRRIPYKAAQCRLYSADVPATVPVFIISDGAVDIRLAVLPAHALRLPLTTTPGGRPMEHAKLQMVEQLLARS
jgi:hypothetical protein